MKYSAVLATVPSVRASVGVPVTVTGCAKVAINWITSPILYVLSAEAATLVTELRLTTIPASETAVKVRLASLPAASLTVAAPRLMELTVMPVAVASPVSTV